jgi:hypothetical protein
LRFLCLVQQQTVYQAVWAQNVRLLPLCCYGYCYYYYSSIPYTHPRTVTDNTIISTQYSKQVQGGSSAVRIPVGERYSSSPNALETDSEDHPAAYSLDIGEPWRRADHSHPSSAKFKNEWSYTSFPPNALKAQTGTSLPLFLPYCTSIPAHDMRSVVCLSVPIRNNASFSSPTLSTIFLIFSVL